MVFKEERVRNKTKLVDLGHVCRAKDLCPRPLSLTTILWVPLLIFPLFTSVLFCKDPTNTELGNSTPLLPGEIQAYIPASL